MCTQCRDHLFGPAVGEEFTHAQLDEALLLLLSAGARVPDAELSDYSVHSFRIYAACALLAAKAPRWLIKRMLRWRGDESLEVYATMDDAKQAQVRSELAKGFSKVSAVSPVDIYAPLPTNAATSLLNPTGTASAQILTEAAQKHGLSAASLQPMDKAEIITTFKMYSPFSPAP